MTILYGHVPAKTNLSIFMFLEWKQVSLISVCNYGWISKVKTRRPMSTKCLRADWEVTTMPGGPMWCEPFLILYRTVVSTEFKENTIEAVTVCHFRIITIEQIILNSVTVAKHLVVPTFWLPMSTQLCIWYVSFFYPGILYLVNVNVASSRYTITKLAYVYMYLNSVREIVRMFKGRTAWHHICRSIHTLHSMHTV